MKASRRSASAPVAATKQYSTSPGAHRPVENGRDSSKTSWSAIVSFAPSMSARKKAESGTTLHPKPGIFEGSG